MKIILMCPFEGVWKEYVIEQKLTGGIICTCVEIILFLCILKRKKGHRRVRSLEFMYGSCLDFTHKLKV